MGVYTYATGVNSIAMGATTYATGNFSAAIGTTTARSYSGISMGAWNDSIAGSNKTAWISTDPLLIIGNGSF